MRGFFQFFALGAGMNSKYKFYKSGAMLTAVALAMRTVAMFFGAFVSRAIGAEGTGVYTIIMTVYSFAITFATSGISLTVTRLVASRIGDGKPDEVGRILRGAVLYSFFFGAVANLFLFFGAGIIGNFILGDVRTVESLRVLSFSLIPIALGSVFSGYFVGVKRVGFNASVQVLAQAFKIAVTVALVNKTRGGSLVGSVFALCLGITLTELIAFAFIFAEYLFDRRKNQSAGAGGMPELKEVMKMALPLAFSAYVRSVLLNIEHILIPKKLRESGETESEAYSHYGTLHGMALPLILYPMSPLSSFSGLLVPEFAEDMAAGRGERMRRIASKAMNATLAYAVITATLIYMFAEELGYVIYDSYDAGYYISTLALVIPIMYLDHVTDSILKGVGEHVFSMWVNITDSCLSVILVWILIPKMGIMGYALVIVIMEGYNFLLSVWRLRRKVGFCIKPIRSVVIPLVSAAFAASLTGALFYSVGSCASALHLTVKMIFAVCITVAMYLILNRSKFVSGQKKENFNIKANK